MTNATLTLLCTVFGVLGCESAAQPGTDTQSSGFVQDPAPLVLEDGASNDFFGYGVALSGTTALVGAPRRAVAENREQGAAYVFVKAGESWQLQATLSADDGASSDHFGLSVALAGDTALIGAPGHAADGNPFQGAAYVFVRDDGHWTQQGKALSASDGAAADTFGTAVALAETASAANAVIGAPYHDVDGHSDQGAAYVFTRTGTDWSQRGDALVGRNGLAGEVFGSAVAISDSTALVGAPIHQVGANPYQGGVYVFIDDGNNWTQQGDELTASDGGAFDQMSPCAISGDIALAGAPYHVVDNHPMRGAAYVFERHDGLWHQRTRLLASDGADRDQFGSAVTLAVGAALIAAPGRNGTDNGPGGGVYFLAPDAQGAWLEHGPAWSSDEGAPNETFGPAVALTDNAALVGSPYRSIGESSAQGVVYTFTGPAAN